MYRLSPNIELLFSEAGPDLADRVRAAAAAGFDAVEMWQTSTRDVPAIAAALRETGVSMTGILAEPRTNFAMPWETMDAFFAGLDKGVEAARTLGCPRIVLGSGSGFGGAKRTANHERLAEIFTQAAERVAGSGITLVLEPVNTRVDHPGALLDHTADAVEVVRMVGSDDLRLLFDLYHSVAQGEDATLALKGAADVIAYVQIADAPGRGEPGTGDIDWAARLGELRAVGYDGPIGLEYVPTTETVASVQHIRSLAASA
ncbi:hydroxypyruvate isomerase [Klenkia soli]|uniref:Hydroxypyruvate isomerase n=1 Tax=Klenkia soli TaxID=1052260 RepID=A0A1H0LMS6_9ACTN|nr:TIM barrel protein [Klenkia soli]SDO69291.1 hydroxypyruvate isomerase [Klenkia soli]